MKTTRCAINQDRIIQPLRIIKNQNFHDIDLRVENTLDEQKASQLTVQIVVDSILTKSAALLKGKLVGRATKLVTSSVSVVHTHNTLVWFYDTSTDAGNNHR